MSKEKESRALLEVRKWKKAVAEEARKLKGQARLDYYNQGIKTVSRKKAA